MITKNTECDSPEPQSVFSPLEYFIQSLDSPPMVWEWELEAQDCLCSLCNWQKRKADEVKGWKGLENNNKNIVANKPTSLWTDQQPAAKTRSRMEEWMQRNGRAAWCDPAPQWVHPNYSQTLLFNLLGRYGGDHNSADLDKRLNLEGNVFNTMFCIWANPPKMIKQRKKVSPSDCGLNTFWDHLDFWGQFGLFGEIWTNGWPWNMKLCLSFWKNPK